MLRVLSPEESADHKIREMAETAAIVFLARRWTYYHSDEYGIPDPKELEDTIGELIDVGGGETGRILVEKNADGYGGVDVFLRLGEFSVEEVEFV